ncbi:MAG: DUF554 domain-containing protein [Dethiobacter sp.]|nr:DUF554 domain-containing protein [Dethiobacter sp.]
MQGTFVNGAAIIIGALIGLLFGRVVPERIHVVSMQGIGLAVLLIGLQMAVRSEHLLLVIFSLVLGGIAGELIGLEERLLGLGERLEKVLGKKQPQLARAFMNATLIYAVGAMSVTGALESGLLGRHQILYAKSALDGISAVVFASTMGIGVAFSAFPVMFYQGAIALLAGWASVFLTETVIVEFSAVGGLLIVAIGLNILQIKTLKVGNLLPALLFNVLLVYWLAS